MKNLLLHSIVLAAAFVFALHANSAFGQSAFQPNQARTQSSIQTRGVAETGPGTPIGPAVEIQRPWKLESRIHLERDTNQGYLVVQLDLAEGYHVYSLNEEGSPSPTLLTVLPSNDLRMVSKFASDKPPIVIEKDPVFEQRIEKHKGQVQFFASIEVRPGVDLEKLSQVVQFSGQVCSDSACQPIRKQAATAKFSGYFQVPKTRNAANDQQLK